MKTITITKENLHLIAHRVKQFYKRVKYVKDMQYYPSGKSYNKFFKPTKFIEQKVEESIPYVFLAENCTIEARKDGVFINPNIPNIMGNLFAIGEKIAFGSNEIYHYNKVHVCLMFSKSPEKTPLAVFSSSNEEEYNESVKRIREDAYYYRDYYDRFEEDYDFQEDLLIN